MVTDKVNESHKVGYYRLCTLSLDKLYNVVVCGGVVFYKYLTDNSDTGLFNIKRRNRIKVGNDSLYILIETCKRQALYLALQLFVPLLVHLVRCALFSLIRTHTVYATAEQISVNYRYERTVYQRKRQRETGILLHSDNVQRNQRNIVKSCVLQSLFEHTDIVRGTAGTARLGDKHRYLVLVILAVIERIEKLAYSNNSRVAGIVVDVL